MLRLFDPNVTQRDARAQMVYVSPVDWHSMWQRPQELAARMSRHFDVHYCDPVGLRSVRWGDVARIFRRVAPRGSVQRVSRETFRPKYVPLLGVPGLRAINKRWLLRQASPLTDVGSDPWILWIGSPSLLAESLIESTRPSLVVYDCMDRYAAFHRQREQPRICRTERMIVEQADVVFTSSVTLQEELSAWSEHVVLVPNGADVQKFGGEAPPSPQWIARLESPVVGFHGTLGDWIDYELLSQLAKRRPDWTFVFIGPLATIKTGRLFSLKNVHWHPEMSHEELPQCAARFDVGIIPFALNELTRSVHPIKVLEYLALGMPVVSTELPDLQPMSSVVRFANDVSQWERQLAMAMSHDEQVPLARERRRQSVREHTWERREQQILRELQAAQQRRERLRTTRPRIFDPAVQRDQRAA